MDVFGLFGVGRAVRDRRIKTDFMNSAFPLRCHSQRFLDGELRFRLKCCLKAAFFVIFAVLKQQNGEAEGKIQSVDRECHAGISKRHFTFHQVEVTADLSHRCQRRRQNAPFASTDEVGHLQSRLHLSRINHIFTVLRLRVTNLNQISSARDVSRVSA